MYLYTTNSNAEHKATRDYYPWAILLLVVLTRAPLIGNYLGEPDTARYVFGLRFWILSGSAGKSIINADLSSGYYWLAAALVRLLSVPYADFPFLLNCISLISAMIFGVSLYRLSIRFIDRRAAAVAAGVILLAPSVWWAGIQPHPQGLASALFLTSLCISTGVWLEVSRAELIARTTASSFVLCAAFLMKSDLVLACGAFFAAIFLVRRDVRIVNVPTSHRAFYGAIIHGLCIIVPAYVGYWLVKRAIIGPEAVATADSAIRHIEQYLSLPSAKEFIVQAIPILFSHGPIALLVAIGGTVLWIARGDNRRFGWILLLSVWTLPGYVFWQLISGNNVRHLLLYPIPCFWMAAAWAQKRGTRWLVVSAAIVVIGDLLVPANSGLNLFPSPNVPVSAQLNRRKQAVLRSVGADLLSGNASRSCYFGAYTVDYVEAFLLKELDERSMHERLLSVDQFRIDVTRADGTWDRRVDIIRISRAPSPAQSMGCSVVRTTEYNAVGERIRYFGTEWGNAL